MAITGTLENWSRDRYARVLWGQIHGDVKERFADGTLIHTSYIEGDLTGLMEGDIIHTLNSSYRLGKPREL